MQVGETLLLKGIITRDQLEKALEEQKKSSARLGEIIAQLGFATKEKIEEALK